jgi:hypothetical protein
MGLRVKTIECACDVSLCDQVVAVSIEYGGYGRREFYDYNIGWSARGPLPKEWTWQKDELRCPRHSK